MDGDLRNWSHALGTSPAFWLAMFAASAFGTNLGDLWTGRLGLPWLAGFGSLVVVSALAIWGDRRMGLRTEFAYWAAIVVLRAAATNVADFLTEVLHLGFVPVALGLAVVALTMGSRTRAGLVGQRGASPVIGGWYWTAMFVAGVFGTVAGDLMNRTVGVLASAGVVQNEPFLGHTGVRRPPACEGRISTGRVSCVGGGWPPCGQACWG